jgi:hypothetical protein
MSCCTLILAVKKVSLFSGLILGNFQVNVVELLRNKDAGINRTSPIILNNLL